MKAAQHPTVTVTSSKERRKMLRSQSLPHVELRRFKLVKQGSTSSQLSQVRERDGHGFGQLAVKLTATSVYTL